MQKESLSFLERFMKTCTPSGFEAEGQLLWKERTKAFCESVKSDVHGNIIAVLNPKAHTRIMLAGHCDEIGLMVTHISDEGLIHFTSIGGVDAGVLPGMHVRFLYKGGVCGVIGKKPIHMVKKEDREKVIEIKELMIDIGAKNRKDAEKHVKVGTAACGLPNFLPLLNGMAASKAFDDKIGAFVVSEAVRIISQNAKRLNVAVYGVSTVQEEIGSRGARTSCFGIDAHAGIAIDVGFATDVPGDEKKVYGDVSLGEGPILHRGANINPVLGGMLENSATRAKIPVQWTAEPNATSTDADVLQINRSGMAAALVSVPVRYMHTPVEVCCLADIENTAKLIAETVLSMPERPKFEPY
jgi:tetrahedral aminopeptidase